MMSNNTYSSSPSASPSLAKEQELQKFESSFFPAGGAPQLANIPQAPPAPTNLNNVNARPINLKTRNWGPKLENGFGGLNRSLYDRPNVFYWDSRPVLGERPHLTNNNNWSSFPSTSTTSTSTSRSLADNIPSCPAAPVHLLNDRHLTTIRGKRLRIRNWGHPTANGWTGMNRELYNKGMTLERDVLLNELRFKYGPRGNMNNMERGIPNGLNNFNQQGLNNMSEFNQQGLNNMSNIYPTGLTNIVENVPIATTTLMETGPAKVLATTVPVPMLNPPINDGRRYAKLYKRNTNALASDKGISKLVKRRGTRRDHLVQPTTFGSPITTLGVPFAGATVIQPATLVGETRSVLPVGTTTGVLPVTTAYPTAYPTALAPTVLPLTKAEQKERKRELRSQQKLAKKEQRAARKANKNGGVVAPTTIPIMSAAPMTTFAPMTSYAPLTTVAPMTSVVPLQTINTMPMDAGLLAQPTAFSSMPMTEQPITFVGETRNVLPQEASLLSAPATTTVMPLTTVAPLTTGTEVLAPVGVSAQPLDHSHVLAGQLGNAPIKRPRRARKATKGKEQPMYSNIISSTPAPVVATTTMSTVPVTTTIPSVVEGNTVVQPATLVSETRNIIVDPLVQQQQGMIKQEYNTAPAISPLAMGNPIM